MAPVGGGTCTSLQAACLWVAGFPPEVFWLTWGLPALWPLAFLLSTGWIPGC